MFQILISRRTYSTMGRISRFGVYVGDYMKRLYRDYKFSLVDAKEMCARRRGRTGFALGTIATAVYAMNTNPDMQDYHDALVGYQSNLID